MPSRERVNFAQLKVGILGIVALTCIALLVFLLTGNMHWFKKEIPLRVYTSDAGGLAKSSPVRLNGIQAGTVQAVDLSGEMDPAKVIRIDLVVDEDMMKQIPADSVARIASDNLLGSTKFLQITKGTSHSLIQPNATLNSFSSPDFDQILEKGDNIFNSLQLLLGKVQDIVGQIEVGKGTIGKLLVDETLYNSLQATVSQLELLATNLNSTKGTIGHLINDGQLYGQIQDVMTQFTGLLTGLQKGEGTAGMLLKDPKIANDFHTTLNELNTMLADLNAGKGTAGQILKNDKLANQFSQTLDKVNLTVDKVNAGQGTLGQLLVNPALYDSATGATRELHELLKDFRANPKKFLSIKLNLF
jgi:phospholipid/cholesterol/gamma-HCH transport system substrate-binding protein